MDKVIYEKATNLGADRRTALQDATLEGRRNLGGKGDGEGDLAVWSDR
jgi:hypothetical protein